MAKVAETIWLDRKEAALFLTKIGCPVSAKRLANMASNNNAGKGPAYTRIGWAQVRYEERDLRTWAETRVVRIE